MILVNKNFNVWAVGSIDGYIEVPNNFEPVFKFPEAGFEWVWVDFEKGTYKQQKIVIPKLEKTPELEQEWVVSEFKDFVDPLANMFWSGDSRANAYNEQEIKDYSNQLRDYVTKNNGKLTINGDRPPQPQKIK